MTKEAIVAAAAKLETTHDLLNLLNKIKMAELGDRGYPFIMPHLNYFIHPARNKKSYKTFQIPKKSGGVREISAPKTLLKSFLTYTNRLLQAFYEGPEYVTGFVPERSIVDNAERHIGMNYVFNTDLKDFFPSITKSRVWATLKHPPFSFNDTVADAIAGLCCTEVKIEGEKCWVLPQGSPCSPILTNIVCRNLDRQLYKLSKKYNLRYSRYADDITFSSNRNVFQKGEEFQQELETIITGQQFVINEKKTRLQKKNERQEVTGLVVSDRVNVTREYIRGLDNLLYIWEKHGEADAYAKFLAHYTPKQNLHNHKPNMQAVIQGKLHYLKMVKGADNEVWRRLQRRFNKLSGAKPSLETAWIKYKYTISDFEKKIGVKLAFDPDDNGLLHCSFTLNGKRTPVALSRYARTRVTNILSKDDLSLLERFKNSYLIIIYEWGEDCLWRIERKRRQVKQEPAHDIDKVSIIDDIAALTSQGDDVAPEQNESGKNTDEILAALVASDFDLNTLDEWDKIKSS
ncbi:MAG TPA: reverse transcriptase family protein [candidate division Zixibacteria bacterium]|mgnify:CR=1 FL=1|nr:reverse transcriptase family protein [candidate division Zixibacteria bacterium]